MRSTHWLLPVLTTAVLTTALHSQEPEPAKNKAGNGRNATSKPRGDATQDCGADPTAGMPPPVTKTSAPCKQYAHIVLDNVFINAVGISVQVKRIRFMYKGEGLSCINMYSSNPNRRMQELLNSSEDLQQIQNEWERIWFADQVKADHNVGALAGAACHAPGVDAAIGAGAGALTGAVVGHSVDQSEEKAKNDAAAANQAQQQAQQMGVADVAKMAQRHITDEVMITHIRTGGVVYHLSVPEIEYLKANGVSDAVVMEMQATANSVPPPPPPVSQGIYAK